MPDPTRRFLITKNFLYSLIVISLSLQCWSITFAQTQEPTPRPDARDAAAREALQEGFRLLEQRTVESLNAALGQLETARSLFHETTNQPGEAKSLVGLGRINDLLGGKQQSLAYYEQALLIFRAVGDRAGVALTLNNIGFVYDSLGEKQKALEYYNQALPLRRAVGDRAGEGTTLNNIGLVYDSLGEKQKALEYYDQALPVLRSVGDRAV